MQLRCVRSTPFGWKNKQLLCHLLQVVHALQTVPHSRAQAVLLPDTEELAACEAAAAESLDALQAEVPTMLAMQAARGAAHAAAAACAAAWWEYEAGGARSEGKVALIDGEDEAMAMAFGRRLVAIGGKEFVTLPFAALTEASSPSLDGVNRAAEAAAAEAAARFVAAVGLQPALPGGDGVSSTDDACAILLGSAASLRGANTTVDRGVASSSGKEVLADEERSLPPEAAGPQVAALQLEARVWGELDAIRALAEEISRRPPAPLLPGLLCLRPPSNLGEAEEEGQAPPAADARYPALRRMQRLSFALASCLVDVSSSEGRQALLEAGSTTSRLRLALAALRRHRKVLAAVAAVRRISKQDGGQ